MSNDFNNQLATLDQAARQSHTAEQAAKSVAEARVKLVLGKDARSVFFATILMRLQLEQATDHPTMATDGRRLKYNPDFIAGLSKDELQGVLAHEALHVTNCHTARRGDRDPKLWNISCDCAINPILRDCGFTLPDGAIFPGQDEYSKIPPNLSAEQIYTLVQQQQGARPQAGGDQPDHGDGESPNVDPGGCGGVEEPGDGSPSALRQAEADGKLLAAQAQQAAGKRAGNLPGSLITCVEELLQPKADWRAILREFVSRHARNDYSWSFPNRRYIAMGIYLPGLRSEELGDITLMVDTSGSTQAILPVFAAEINAILDGFDCKLTIAYHDTKVQKVVEWSTSDGPLKLECPGGGGTSHRPVFDWLEKQDQNPTCVVALTDAETVYPTRAPLCPVLWCIAENPSAKPPFGQAVYLPKS